jgi:putative tricarboxylic transport membrane protein
MKGGSVMKSGKIYGSLFWLLFSVVVSREAFRLPMGEMKDPGAGFFPLMIGMVTGLLALIALFRSLREKRGPSAPRPTEPFRWWNLVVILAALVAYALTLTKVGFMINTFLFMLLLVKVIEPQAWKKAVLAAMITAVAADLFFNVLLGAQIPSGILGF